MSALVENIRNEALNLPPEERRELIHALLDSLSTDEAADFATAWDDEIARRIREVEQGKVKCVSHEEVMAKARAACK